MLLQEAVQGFARDARALSSASAHADIIVEDDNSRPGSSGPRAPQPQPQPESSCKRVDLVTLLTPLGVLAAVAVALARRRAREPALAR